MARTGRPKKSADIACTCKACGKQYTVPDWRQTGRLYCSRECWASDSSRRKGGNHTVEPTIKTCPQCGKEFLVGGRGRPRVHTTYCSNACAAQALGYQAAPRQMTEVEAAWLAGVFDGEGSIVFPRQGRTDCRISITNTHYPLLEHIIAVTGTGANIKRTMLNAKHSQSWAWQCYSTNARNLLRQMLPWLIVKREKALIALGESDPLLGGTLVSHRVFEDVTLRDGETASFTITVPLP